MNPYETIGMPRVINAAGKMTYLGSSAVDPIVVEKIGKVARSYVNIEALKERIGLLTGSKIGSENACITTCCAAGIAISVAATLTGKDFSKVEALPRVEWTPNEIVIQKGHMVNFGANIEQAIRITGATIKEIGSVNSTKGYHMISAIDQNTAAVVYVVSHHAVSNGMLSLEDTIEIAHEAGVPVIVDAAAETDLKRYAKCGADLVAFSGHKAIGGPTSGVIIGRSELVQACQMQDKGIARMMKVGKENLMGFYFALEHYLSIDENTKIDQYCNLVKRLGEALSGIKTISTNIAWDETRPIPRLRITLQKVCKYKAEELIKLLENNDPSIYTRNHLADEGIIQFDPRELMEEDIDIIGQRMKELL